MPITRKQYGQGSKNINAPGEYVVTVIETKMTMTKAKEDKPARPMRIVVLETPQGQKINGYYVGELAFHMEALKDLKVACGLKPDSNSDDLVGERCGIAVEAQLPGPDGKVFMTIAGYGSVKDVTQAAALSPKEHYEEQHNQTHEEEPDYFGQGPAF